jgi:hypothetical protein
MTIALELLWCRLRLAWINRRLVRLAQRDYGFRSKADAQRWVAAFVSARDLAPDERGAWAMARLRQRPGETAP